MVQRVYYSYIWRGRNELLILCSHWSIKFPPLFFLFLPVSHTPHPIYSFLSNPCFSHLLLPLFFSFYSYWCDRILYRSGRWKKGFMLTHSSRVQIILVLESRHQGLKAISHITATMTKQSAMNSCAQFIFSFLYRPATTPQWVVLPTSINAIEIILPRHALRPITQELLDSGWQPWTSHFASLLVFFYPSFLLVFEDKR